MATEELVTAKLFNKFVKKFSEDTKVERKLRKQTIINTKKELEEHTQAVKDLNKDIKEGNKIQDTAQEKKLQEQIDEIRELKKSTDQASDEYKELSKKETDLMKKFLKVSDEGADHDATMAKRQDLISKRDKASELIREEKDKDRGFASKKMMGLLSGIEKGIGGMWKKGKAAVGLTFKGALIATGLLLLLKFLESKKWQDIKKWLAKEGKEIFDVLMTVFGDMWTYFAGPDSVFKRMSKIMKSFNEIFNPTIVDDTGMSPGAMGGKLKDKSWWTRIGDAWNSLDENMKWWEGVLIAGMTLIGGYFLYKPLRLIYLSGKFLTKLGYKMFTKVWGGMKWMTGWIKGFGTAVNPTPKQLELFKAPKGGWFSKISKGFVTIIGSFKNALSAAVGGAGRWLAELGLRVKNAVPEKFLKYKFVSDSMNKMKNFVSGGAKQVSRWAVRGTVGAYKVGEKLAGGMKAFGMGQVGKARAGAKFLTGKSLKLLSKGVDYAKLATGPAAKKLGKMFAKLIPGVSIGIGTGLAAMAFSRGAYGEAAAEMLSGIVATVPGFGTAASLLIDHAIAESRLSDEEKKSRFGHRNWTKMASKTLGGVKGSQLWKEKQAKLARKNKKEAPPPPPLSPEDFIPVGEGITFTGFQKGLSASSSNLPEHQRIAMWMRRIKNSDYQGAASAPFVYAGKDDHSSVNMSILGADTTTDTSIQSEWLSGP